MMVCSSGTNLESNQPFFDRGADGLGMILLQVVNAGAKLHKLAILEPLRKLLSESRRYQRARIACEKELRVGRLRQGTMCPLQGRIHVHRLSSDRQFIRETPSRQPRLGGRKGRPVNRRFHVRQFSYGCRGKDTLHKRIALKNHLFADTRRSEFLEVLPSRRVKILPTRHWPGKFHKSKATDK